jgi:tetratricopeptide (TPR) repeat protein
LAAEIAIVLDEATVLDWIEEFHRSREKATQAHEAAGRLAGGPGALLEARLTLARARSHIRFNENEAAAPLFLDAARRAEALGDEAYETLVVALLLGGFVLTIVGRLDEAEAAFNRVIPLLAARGDKLHLTGALANRFPLWAAQAAGGADPRRPAAAPRDGPRAGQRAPRIRHPRFAALCLHWIGESRDAESYARRAIEVEDRFLVPAAHLEGRVPSWRASWRCAATSTRRPAARRHPRSPPRGPGARPARRGAAAGRRRAGRRGRPPGARRLARRVAGAGEPGAGGLERRRPRRGGPLVGVGDQRSEMRMVCTVGSLPMTIFSE